MRTNKANTSLLHEPMELRSGLLAGALFTSAFLMALAIEHPEYWWLGWVTLIPLFVAIRVLPPLAAGLCGGFWGAALFGFVSARETTGIAATFTSFVLLTSIPALYAMLGSLLTRRVGFSPFLLSLGWIGVEVALQPLGMRQGLLAGTQDGAVGIRMIGSFAGYALVAFLIAYVNASLLCVLSREPGSVGGRRFAGAGSAPRSVLHAIESLRWLIYLIRRVRPRAPPVVLATV